MTVREKTALILLAVAAIALVGAGFAVGWVWGGVLVAVAVAGGVLGALTLVGGVLLAVDNDDEAPAPARTWLDPLAEWATDPDMVELDFGGLPLPEKMAALLEQLR